MLCLLCWRKVGGERKKGSCKHHRLGSAYPRPTSIHLMATSASSPALKKNTLVRLLIRITVHAPD